jgi:hypothetical protein
MKYGIKNQNMKKEKRFVLQNKCQDRYDAGYLISSSKGIEKPNKK